MNVVTLTYFQLLQFTYFLFLLFNYLLAFKFTYLLRPLTFQITYLLSI